MPGVVIYTDKQKLLFLLRYLGTEEEKYAQNQGNADIEPCIDEKIGPSKIPFYKMENREKQNGYDDKDDDTPDSLFEIICELVLHNQNLFEKGRKAKSNQKSNCNKT